MTTYTYHTIAVDSQLPALSLTAFDAVGKRIDYTTATSVQLVIRQDSAELVNRTFTVASPGSMFTINAAKGRLDYSWQAGETSVAGALEIYIVINWTGSVTQRVPQTGYEQGAILAP